MNEDFTRELLTAREAGSEAVQALAEKHLPLVGMLVKRFPGEGNREELYQQGVVGLMKALRRFNPDRGTSFSTYAAAMILGEMRMLRRQEAILHIPRPEEELRRRIHQAESRLTSLFHREPTMTELAAELRMDPAELALHMDQISVSSTDAQSHEGTPLSEWLADPEDWQKRIELRDILARLPEQDRRLLLLRHRSGLTQAQAGQRLGMTQMQVSRREKIIRTLLKRALTE